MIHPDDAAARGIAEGAMVALSSSTGRVEVVAEITEDVMRGVVSMPHGFGHRRPGVKLAVAQGRGGASINDVTERGRIDPLSGNAALVGTPVIVAVVQDAVAAE